MPNDNVLTISFRGHQVTAEVNDGNVTVTFPQNAMQASTGGPEKALDIALIAQIIQLVLKLLGLFGGGL